LGILYPVHLPDVNGLTIHWTKEQDFAENYVYKTWIDRFKTSRSKINVI